MTTPLATYRLQLHRGFTFRDAAGVTEYLAALGISHVYLSPILQAAPGSRHGYDCVDPERLDAERGGQEAFAALCEACARHGLGIVLDIVPNHLDISGAENRWWQSVLRLGAVSPFARVFDIDWERAVRPGGGIALPILGQEPEEAVRQGLISLAREGGAIEARYFDHRLPLSPGASAALVRRAAERLQGDAAAELSAIARELQGVDGRVPTQDAGAAADGSIDATVEALEERLAAAMGDAAVAAAMDAVLAEVSTAPERLERVLAQQVYRLVYWRETSRDIGYRRFFDVNTLAGVRVEDPAVFERTHRLILDLVKEGKVHGLRVDHPDGLRDPAGYVQRLAEAAPEAWIVVEKILEAEESLPPWPVAGTTGYDFLNDVLAVLVDARAEPKIRALYEEIAGASDDYGEVAFEAKLFAARKILAADLTRLTRLLVHLSKVQDRLRHETVRLREAVGLLAACMPVYRTYIVPGGDGASAEDAERIWTARGHAERRRPELTPEPLGALRDLLLLALRSPAAMDRRSLEAEFVLRFQQYSAPTMAKGVEDTALYRYVPFVALNEVGGNPGRIGLTPGRFHARNLRRLRKWPAGMLSTSTHDTKRSEDVRARLAALSEIPEEWAATVRRWVRLNERCRDERGGVPAGREEYLLYQTLVGAWPIDAERAVAYMRKAVREAKVWTSWLDVNERYEAELEAFVRRVLASKSFADELSLFVARLLRPGRLNSLAQTLLKLTCPGVPDVYQGCDLWDLSLVDPDNRRPVDFALRRRLLERVQPMSPREAWAAVDDPEDPGTVKLWLIHRVLRERALRERAFGEGSSYVPLFVSGRAEDRVIAFSRGDQEGPRAMVVVPRFFAAPGPAAPGEAGRGGGWGDTSVSVPPPLDAPRWSHVLAEGQIGPGECAIGDLLAGGPMALLVESAP